MAAISGYRLLLATIGTSPLWIAVIFFVYGPDNGPGVYPHYGFQRHPRNVPIMTHMNQAKFWNTADMKKMNISEEIVKESKKVLVQEKNIQVEGASVFYREAPGLSASHISVLLLHGMRFSSKTWLELSTIHLLSAMGYRVIAIDLPGYGQTPEASVSPDFLKNLIDELNLVKPVIVSPSMSGAFALPHLLKHWEQMGGYVPVAPIGWDVLEKHKVCEASSAPNVDNVPEPLKAFLKPPVPDLDCIKVPTLVVYGEKDRTRSSALLCLLPFSQPAEIPKGEHPAYLTDPDLWHKLLFNFLDYTERYAQLKGSQ